MIIHRTTNPNIYIYIIDNPLINHWDNGLVVL